MPFDANLVLADNTAAWNFANLNTSDYGTPTSTTRNAGGFTIVDLLALSGTAAKGLAAILILTAAGAAATDALTAKLQGSNSATFASGIHLLASFEVAAATEGIILGNETPTTVIRRFSTKLRYLRLDASVTAGDNFGTVWCVLAPWPFNVL